LKQSGWSRALQETAPKSRIRVTGRPMFWRAIDEGDEDITGIVAPSLRVRELLRDKRRSGERAEAWEYIM
jgi:hypothetical protein